MSPFSTLRAVVTELMVAGSRNFKIGDWRPFSSSKATTLIYANPFAPNFPTKSVYSSIFFLVSSAAPGTRSATTLAFESFAGPENTLNSSFFISSEISSSSNGILRSGLSQPYLVIASLYLMRGTLIGS